MVTGRILIGGQVSGYRGTMPGVIEEVQNTLDAGHHLIALGGFGGAARDVAIGLGLLERNERIAHAQTGPGYEESLGAVRRHAAAYQARARENGIWDNLTAAARTEDPEQAARHVARVWAPLKEILAPQDPPRSPAAR